MRLQTKAQREAVQQATIENLVSKYGYQLNEYKDLKILTSNKNNTYYLQVYKASAAHPINNTAHRTNEEVIKAIENVKKSYDRNTEWKVEQKIKNKGHQSNQAAAAAAIKEELKTVFPGIKFSVKSEGYSGGDSVRIGWTDGPTSDQVEAITAKYQYGRFDGMSDMYENTNSRDDIPQAKYVSESRTISDELNNLLLPIMEEYLKGYEQHTYRDEPREILGRLLRKTAIPVNATVKGIERTDVTCGHIEEFYRIVIELPEAEQAKDETRPEATEVPAGEVQIIEYSDKAIAVIGETKPIKELLKSLGGRFNFRLTCGAGWIFPKSKLEEVIKAIQGNKPTPEPKKEQLQIEAPRTLQNAKDELKEEVNNCIEFFKNTSFN